jgi:exodeoxyribonuclease VII small subunit
MSEEIKFEKAMEKLEEIVEALETGDLSLEEALKRYEEGVKLSAICQKRLAQAEKKVEMLVRLQDGKFSKEPFDVDAVEEKEVKPRKKSVSKETAKDEEDLLL